MTQIREGGVEIPAGMKPWTGGDAAPVDWDTGPVLLRDGRMYTANVIMAEKLNWGRPYADKSAPYQCGDIIAYTPTPSPEIAEQPMGFAWSYNADTRDIEFGNAPVFKVYEAADFPCLENDEHAISDQWFDNQAQTAVLLLNGVMHDAGDDTPIPMPTDPFATARNDIAGLPGHGMSADVQVAEQRAGEVADTEFKRWIKSYVGEINPGSCRYSVDEMRIAFEAGSATPKPADPTSVAGERMRGIEAEGERLHSLAKASNDLARMNGEHRDEWRDKAVRYAEALESITHLRPFGDVKTCRTPRKLVEQMERIALAALAQSNPTDGGMEL